MARHHRPSLLGAHCSQQLPLAATTALGCTQTRSAADSTPHPPRRRPKRRWRPRPTAGGGRYPALIRMWRSCWNEFIPFLDYDTEIRRVLCSTNAIESLNARYRRAIKARGHSLSEAAALKCLDLVTRSLDPKGTGQQPHQSPRRQPTPGPRLPRHPRTTHQYCLTQPSHRVR